MSASTASITRLVRAQRAVEGEGFVVRRPFPTSALSYLDPFLLFDHMGPAEFGPGDGDRLLARVLDPADATPRIVRALVGL